MKLDSSNKILVTFNPFNAYRVILLIILYAFFYSKITYSQDLPQYSILELLADTNIHEINLDVVEPLEVKDGISIPDTYLQNGQRQFHGRLTSTTIFNGDLLVADNTNQMIYRLNENDELEYVVGRSGRGPGEFLDLYHLAANENYLFAQDRRNSKTFILDKNFNVVHEILTSLLAKTVATNDFIFHTGISRINDYLRINKSSHPFEEIGTFLEQIIPIGMQPGGYRFSRSATSINGELLFAVNPMSYLFIFDKYLTHIKSIRLTSTEINTILSNNAPPIPTMETDLEKIRVANVFGDKAILSNRDILISVRHTLYHLKFNGSNYKLKKAYKFSDPNSDDSSPLHLYGFTFDENSNRICIASIFVTELVCYPLILE